MFPAFNSLLVWLMSTVLSLPSHPESCQADMTVMFYVVLCALSRYYASTDFFQFLGKFLLFQNLLNNTVKFPHSS